MDKIIKKISQGSIIAEKMLKVEMISKKIKKMQELKKDLQEEMKELMLEKDIDTLQLDDGQAKLLDVKLSIRTSASYDETKMRKLLHEKQWKAITDRTLVVDEFQLKLFLKKYPHLKEELKNMITSNYVVNENKLDVALKNGTINVKQIKKATTYTQNEVVLIKRKKRENEE